MAAGAREAALDEPPAAKEAAAAWAFALRKTVRYLGPATALGPFDRGRAWALQARWAGEVLERLGVEVRVEDRAGPIDPERGVLFVHLNQQTLLAPLLYAVSLPPCRIIVNVEYALLPLVGWVSVATGGVPIVRQRPEQAKSALGRVTDELRRGAVFGVSIEGRRTQDGRLSPYKKGPAVMAIASGATIIPFMTHGEFALWPRGEWRVRPGRVVTVIYPAISTRGLTYDDRDRVLADLRDLAERETCAGASWRAAP